MHIYVLLNDMEGSNYTRRHGDNQKRSAALPYVTKYNIYNCNAHMAHNIYLN